MWKNYLLSDIYQGLLNYLLLNFEELIGTPSFIKTINH